MLGGEGVDDINKMLNIMDQEQKKKGILKGHVAKYLGVSGGTVSNMFKHKHKIGYMTFIDLTKITFGNYHHDFIRRFCEQANIKMEYEAMEWAYSNSDVEVLRILINKDRERQKSSKKKEKEDNSITAVYELQLQRLAGKIDTEAFYKKTQKMMFSFKSVDAEKLFLLRLNEIYYFIDIHRYECIWPQALSLLEQLDFIKNPYMKTAFKIRVKIALLYTGLRTEKYSECEEIAKELMNEEMFLERFPMYYNNVLVCLSEMYALSDFEKSSSFIKKAVQMMEQGFLHTNEGWKAGIKSTYDFIHIHHNRFDNLYLESLDEQAHYYAKGNKEQKKKALNILNKLADQDGQLDEFGMYYKALALEDVDLMQQTKKFFYKNGDFHYAHLAKSYIEMNSTK